MNIDLELLEDFLSESNDILTEMDLLVENYKTEQDTDKLFKLFHKLLGMSGFLDLPDIQKLCQDGQKLLFPNKDKTLDANDLKSVKLIFLNLKNGFEKLSSQVTIQKN